MFNRLQLGKAPTPEAAPPTKGCPFCFSTIPIQATRCPHCTSKLSNEEGT